MGVVVNPPRCCFVLTDPPLHCVDCIISTVLPSEACDSPRLEGIIYLLLPLSPLFFFLSSFFLFLPSAFPPSSFTLPPPFLPPFLPPPPSSSLSPSFPSSSSFLPPPSSFLLLLPSSLPVKELLFRHYEVSLSP